MKTRLIILLSLLVCIVLPLAAGKGKKKRTFQHVETFYPDAQYSSSSLDSGYNKAKEAYDEATWTAYAILTSAKKNSKKNHVSTNQIIQQTP